MSATTTRPALGAARRVDFPTLSRTVHGKRLAYLDSGASSQTPQVVMDAMDRYYSEYRSNVHRGVYQLAEEATDHYESGRTGIARFLDTPAEGVVLTKNATEAINLVAYSWVRHNLGPDDAMLTTRMEHHANFVPYLHARQDRGFDLRTIPLTSDGRLDMAAAQELLADGKVRYLALVHVSNVLGTINDVAALAEMARAANPDCVVLVDGSQAAPQMPVSVRDLGVDFYVLTGHKMCGPTGIGVLAARPELLDSMPPFLAGGDMILDVTLDSFTTNEVPHKFEAGTPMIAEAGGLGAAVEYLEALGMDNVRAHEHRMVGAMLDALHSVDGVTVYGPHDVDLRGGAVSFALDGVHPHDIGAMLDSHGVAIRVGHHCAKPLMRELQVNATARASAYLYNDLDDLEPLVAGLQEARSFFAR
ncbi:MAG TPA: SufS family cysteine desulfurase [Nitriliruptoraceae bacterium]|nr:SufS family cysteine desulfurase [Nitriliruptoraceae bacterium]